MTRRNSRPPKGPRISGSPRKRKTASKSKPKPPTFSMEVRVTGKTYPLARIYKGTELKNLARAKCTTVDSPNSEYWVVFTREHSAKDAHTLRVGELITLEDARFFDYPGSRSGTELHTKRFRRSGVRPDVGTSLPIAESKSDKVRDFGAPPQS